MGVTSYSITQHGVRVDAVEISKGVIDSARSHFSHVNHDVLDNPLFSHYINDGRNHILMTKQKYDMISNRNHSSIGQRRKFKHLHGGFLSTLPANSDRRRNHVPMGAVAPRARGTLQDNREDIRQRVSTTQRSGTNIPRTSLF